MLPTLFRAAAIGLLCLVAIGCGWVGGPSNALDVLLIRDGIAARALSPLPTDAGLALNIVGGVATTLGIAALAAALLWFRGAARRALLFAAIVVGGRLLIEALKDLVHRARPALDAHPVAIRSLSFPSAHAGNSMIVFTALVLFFVPSGRRAPWLAAAVAGSLLVGASRSLIGVHWPSDVLAGWAVGAAWMLACWPLARRLGADEAEHDVVGGHRAARVEK